MFSLSNQKIHNEMCWKATTSNEEPAENLSADFHQHMFVQSTGGVWGERVWSPADRCQHTAQQHSATACGCLLHHRQLCLSAGQRSGPLLHIVCIRTIFSNMLLHVLNQNSLPGFQSTFTRIIFSVVIIEDIFSTTCALYPHLPRSS